MGQDSICYELESELAHDGDSGELAPERLADWILEVKAMGLRQAVPRFVVLLERLSRLALAPARRVDALRLLLRPVVVLAAGLPESGDPGRVGTISLRQRLYCLLVKNLKQALHDLDRSAAAFAVQTEVSRRWVLNQLFRLLGRQIEYAVQTARPLPPGTWRELHDLHIYWRGRAEREVESAALLGASAEDPDQAYLRLLLLGLAVRLAGGAPVTPQTWDQLPRWANQSRLADPESYVGEIGPFIVEIALDEPPRQVPGLLPAAFHGYVLVTPPDFRRAAEPARFGVDRPSPRPLQRPAAPR
jgi:hypothetical protein